MRVPLCPVRHQYLITERIEGVTPGLPTLRDPDRLIYFKEEVGGLVVGGYEPDPKPWAVDGIPESFHFSLLDPDWDHFEQLMGPAMTRVPALEQAGIKQLINGPESFTPDGNFILGEAPELKGFYVGCGFNAFGIAAGGGAGKALAEWIAAGEPPMDLWPVDIRRFGSPHGDDGFVRARTLELYGKHYTIAWPGEEHGSGRPLRRSPLYDRLRASGAVFGEKLGFERANWFARRLLDEPRDVYSFGRPNWFEAVGVEHQACRERVALFDARLVREVPAGRARCRAGSVLDLCQRCDRTAGQGRLHPDAEREGRHRVRSHGHPACRGCLLHRDRHRLCDPRLQLDRAPPPGRRRCAPCGCDLGLRRPAADGPVRPRSPAAGDGRRPRQGRLPVRQRPGDPDRRRAGAGAARDLRRRARMGAARAESTTRRRSSMPCSRPASRSA